MEVFNDFITLVSNVGFPIVAFYLMYKQNNDIIEKCRSTIEKNTKILERLATRLESEVLQNENK